MDKSIENIVFMAFMLFMVVGGLSTFATYEHHKEKENKKWVLIFLMVIFVKEDKKDEQG